MMHEKIVSLGSRLHYPITVTKLLKSPGDAVKKQENILEYKFSWRRKVGDDTWTDETTYTEFDSPAEGKLKDWRISEGMVISADMPCMTVEEACGHEVQIQGLCSLCGADMTEINWASEERDTDRAMINMTHDQTGLMVSESVAKKAEHDTQKRLLRQRKLSLVVDLDQTIIHACIEPTVGEWQRDPTNPNHAAVKGVKSFQLNEDGSRGLASGCIYYIKLRPGLEQFLNEVSKMYELHVYTMGTRAYALNIARIVDPERKLFGNRVISRDENGSITSKSLQRLFPVSTNMVVIIDDRADVWPRNRQNLIKVVPYDFFKGIGDINSSFLPKRTDVVPSAQQPNGIPAAFDTTSSAVTVQGEEAKASPLSEIARIAGVDDPATLKLQAEEQEKTLEKQLTDRPLLHMQEELDKKDELSSQGPDADQSASPNPPRQHLLSDDDEELMALQDHLTDLHSSFYDMYDRRRADRREAEPTHPPGSAKGRRRSIVDDGVDLSMVPDVGDILYKLKSNVLSGLVIVLSGLVPLGVKVEESEIGMQAQSFGAQVLDTLSKRVTHLVVSTSRPRTKKVQQAVSLPSIKIVNHNWLIDCLSQWRRLDEGPYFLDVLDPNREQDRPDDAAEGASETETGGGGGDGDEAKDFRDFDWATADKDLEEFLGDDDDDDDEEEEEEDEEKEGEDGNGASEEHDDGTTDAGSVTGEAAEEARANTQSGSSRSSRSSSSSGIGSSGKNSSNSNGQRNGDKRKKRADETDEDGTPKAADGSVTAKKQRLSRGRGLSVLRSVYTTSNDDGGSGGSGSSSSSDGSEAVFTPNSPREVQESTRLAGDDAGADSDLDEALERELLVELEAAGD